MIYISLRKQVTDLLDRLYAKFDALADFHCVYKIETIGDGEKIPRITVELEDLVMIIITIEVLTSRTSKRVVEWLSCLTALLFKVGVGVERV